MKLTRIRILSDGRPGHENQSVGLADALARRTGASVELVRIDPKAGLLARIAKARELPAGAESPQLIIGVGHRMHLPLWLAARRFDAKSVVIMSPSLPTWLFDLCLVPRHDLKAPGDRGRIVATRGALNRISEERPAKTATGVILIGGPSKHHGWEGEPLAAAIREIVRARPGLAWTVGDSRRTPAGFIDGLSGCGADLVPHQQTQPGWLPKTLGEAREVWVTEDSVSMIFEAVTAGARVGVLPMPVKNPCGRTLRAVADLIADGYVLPYGRWREHAGELPAAPPLHETGRCADVILRHLFTPDPS